MTRHELINILIQHGTIGQKHWLLKFDADKSISDNLDENLKLFLSKYDLLKYDPNIKFVRSRKDGIDFQVSLHVLIKNLKSDFKPS